MKATVSARVALGVLATIVAGGASADTCIRLNSDSAVDQAFLEQLRVAKIAYTLPSGASACFAEADVARARALRSQVAGANPQQCLTLEKAWNASRLAEALRERRIPAWRENSVEGFTVCHLARDAGRVDEVVAEEFPKAK